MGGLGRDRSARRGRVPRHSGSGDANRDRRITRASASDNVARLPEDRRRYDHPAVSIGVTGEVRDATTPRIYSVAPMGPSSRPSARAATRVVVCTDDIFRDSVFRDDIELHLQAGIDSDALLPRGGATQYGLKAQTPRGGACSLASLLID